jgi:hypothetical protein
VAASFALGLLELLDEDTTVDLTTATTEVVTASPPEEGIVSSAPDKTSAVANLEDMLQIIFEPFFDKMDNYTALESTQLRRDLDQAGAMRCLDDIIKAQNSESAANGDGGNTSQLFQEFNASMNIPLSMDPGPFQSAVDGLGLSIFQLPAILEGGVSRCLAFTGGVESLQLLKAMTSTVQEFCSYLQGVNRQLRMYCLQSTTPVSSSLDLGGGARATSESVTVTAKEIFTRYNWAFLHSSLRLVEHFTKLQRRLSEADTYIRHTLLEKCPPVLRTHGKTSVNDILRDGERGMVRVVSQIRAQRNARLGADLTALLHSFEDVHAFALPLAARALLVEVGRGCQLVRAVNVVIIVRRRRHHRCSSSLSLSPSIIVLRRRRP